MSPQSVVILQVIHPLLWLAWFIYWMISALGNKTTVRRETWAQRIPYTLPLVVSILLLLNPDLVPPLERRFWSQNLVTYWLGTALVASGLLFTVWARRTLGRNWSGTVTVKQDHELIQSGPYRWVRHPIYTGLLIALAGSAISTDLWVGVLAWLVALVSFYLKLLREEAWMREVFGEKYDAYARRTARLFPGVL